MKIVTCEILVTRDERPLFKTQSMPAYACAKVYEELKDKFRMEMYDVRIIKKTLYQGYSELKNVTKETEKDTLF